MLFAFLVLILLSWLVVFLCHKAAMETDRAVDWIGLCLVVCVVVVVDLVLLNELARVLARQMMG